MSSAPQTPNQPGQGTRQELPPGYPAWPQNSYYAEDPRIKSPILAGILSLMPGLGQIYLGYYQQGFVNVLVVAGLIAILTKLNTSGLLALTGIFLAFFWLYNMIDAARRASLYNQMLSGLGPTQLPEDAQAPSTKGSLIGGVVLIAFGLLLFAHTKFDYSLDWLDDWWPVGLVIAGAFLIYSWIRDQRGRTQSS